MIVPKNSKEVVKNDLNYICKNLEEEFSCISGKCLLITGGAGFLGYYLIQSILEWNQTVSPRDKIHITVYDIKQSKCRKKKKSYIILKKKKNNILAQKNILV